MSNYEHGVRIQENPTSIPTPVKNEAGVPVIVGTAPINLANDPSNATNKIFLCNTFDEAKKALGYSEDYASYTLCEAMDAFFKIYGVGPVAFINVLDPATHSKSYTESINVVDGIAKATKLGVLTNGLTVVKGDDTLVEGTDYTLSFDDDGYLTVTLVATATTVTLAGRQLDPSIVTASSVIGGIDASTGAETGLELVRKLYPTLGVTPSLIVAPGFSKNPAVALIMGEKCDDINGSFKCECVVDLDCTPTGTIKYTDVKTAKENAGYTNPHMIVLWPMVKVNGKVMNFSSVYAALVSYTDYNNDNVPSLSPSNKDLRITATVLANGDEVNLDQLQANELNAAGVVTAINLNGYKSWGNNTAAYPSSIDPKDRWIACRRFFSWWGNTFIATYLSKVDDMANYRLIESIVDSENVRGNALTSQGKCAGIKMVFSRDDNPVENILAGKIVFKQYLAPYTPAEDILNVLEYDVDMLSASLGGE